MNKIDALISIVVKTVRNSLGVSDKGKSDVTFGNLATTKFSENACH